MTTTHSELEQQVIDYLTLRGWLVIQTHDPRHRPPESGVADLVAVRRGGSLLLEVKAGRDRQSDDQRVFCARAARYGLQVHEIRSLEDVMRLPEIRDMGR